MDLLYSRYASPFEFMSLYIEQGRFGEFVSELYEMFIEREKEKVEKENDDRLWSLYIRSLSEKSFTDWKADLHSNAGDDFGDNPVTSKDVSTAIRKSQDILGSFVPD